MDATITDGQAEVVFLWNHPERGKIQLRCSSSLDQETQSGYSVIGYVHITKDLHVFTIEDVHSKIRSALEELYFCNYYIRLKDYSFEIYKAQPYVYDMIKPGETAVEVIRAYIRSMVSEESKADMTEFLDLKTVAQRLQTCNALSQIYYDLHIGRARARIVVVDRDKEGNAESVLLVVETVEA